MSHYFDDLLRNVRQATNRFLIFIIILNSVVTCRVDCMEWTCPVRDLAMNNEGCDSTVARGRS